LPGGVATAKENNNNNPRPSSSSSSSSSSNRTTDHFYHPEKIWDPIEIHWNESLDTFVPYPRDAYSIIKERESYMVHPEVPIYIMEDIPTEWNRSVYRLIKAIVHRIPSVDVRSNYFVQDGLSAGCFDPNKDDDKKQQLPANCSRHCTNHGRYCLQQHNNNNNRSNSDYNIPGSEWIKEVVRRMCFEYLLHDTGIALLDYMDGFHKAQCFTYTSMVSEINDSNNDSNNWSMSNCANQVLSKLQIFADKKDAMQSCFDRAGGFEGNNKNLELEDALTVENQLLLPQAWDVAQSVLPILVINWIPYTGNFTVRDIFHRVCEVFPTKARPIACDFCSDCDDVRRCLWQLKCNETSFDTPTFQATMEAKQAEAITAAAKPSASSSSNSVFHFAEPTGKQVGIIWGGVCALMIVAFFVIRDSKSRYRSRRQQEMTGLSWQPESRGLPNLDTVAENLNIRNHGEYMDRIEESIEGPDREVSTNSTAYGVSVRNERGHLV